MALRMCLRDEVGARNDPTTGGSFGIANDCCLLCVIATEPVCVRSGARASGTQEPNPRARSARLGKVEWIAVALAAPARVPGALRASSRSPGYDDSS
jgi:hypothetical protein